jgi:hypothetical protein
MAVPPGADLSMPPPPPPDLAPTPVPGLIVFTDVVGSGFANVGTTELRANGTHLFGTITDLSGTPNTNVFSNFQYAPGAVTGCRMQRYTTSSLPNSDINVGQISFTGYNNTGLKVGAPCLANLAGVPGLPAVVPNTINCNRTTPATTYDCIYGVGPISNNGACTVAGDPANTANGWNTHSSAAAVVGASPVGPVNADPTILRAGDNVTINIGGGAGFPATSRTITPALVPTLVSAANGMSAANLSDLNAGVLNRAADLTITWSCDGSATPGGGCAGAADGDLIGVQLVTSTVARGGPFAFPITGTNPYGMGECYEQTRKAGGSITIPAAAVAAMTAPGTDHSFQIILVRVNTSPLVGTSGQILLAAGRGIYGFLNIP